MTRALRQAWGAWKIVGQVIGDFVARLVLTLFYFTVFALFAVGVRLATDPLSLAKRSRPSWWLARSANAESLSDASRQG